MAFEVSAYVTFLNEDGSINRKSNISFFKRFDNIFKACSYFCYIYFKLKKYEETNGVYIDLPVIKVVRKGG